MADRLIHLAGVNSNDIYGLRYPDSLLKFISFDFSNFIRRCTDFCKRSEAEGSYNIDEAVALRASISACHRFFEANIHGTFEKIIPDFFIEYLCRERGVGTSTLWNSLINAKNMFEKTVFLRLTEYRRNKAVNSWVNLLQIQEYARRKTDFIFGEYCDLNEALAKRDYFDLAFSVAANEMGYPLSCFCSAGVYSVGRLPSSPFIAGTVAKEIAKTALSQLEVGDEPIKDFTPLHSDSEAMQVFASIKNLIPSRTDSVLNTIMKTMRSLPKKVYVARTFKEIIDLEIDLLLESKGVLQRCRRCGEYFVKDEQYDYEYCNKMQPNGKTCLEISNTVPPRTPEEIERLDNMTSELYTFMSKRINVDLTQRDFAEWYQYFMAIKENIAHRRLSIAEFKDFEQYSKDLRFTPPPPPEPVTPPPQQNIQPAFPTEPGAALQPQPAREPEIKPFVFQRIDRSELYEQENQRRKKAASESYDYYPEPPARPANVPADTEELKPAVKVIKADEAGGVSFKPYENSFDEKPFEGVFDEDLKKLEDIKPDFAPLDEIFSFDDNIPAVNNTPTAPDDGFVEDNYERYQPKAAKTGNPDKAVKAAKPPVVDNPAVTDDYEDLPISEDAVAFDKEFAKASFNRKQMTKADYAAKIYQRSQNYEVEEIPEAEPVREPFSDIQSDGADRMTESDFDILPAMSGVSPVAPPEIKRAEVPRVADKKPASKPSPVIKLNALDVDNNESISESSYVPETIEQYIGTQDSAEPDAGMANTKPPKAQGNKTKRVLDGLFNPVKTHNPFISDDE